MLKIQLHSLTGGTEKQKTEFRAGLAILEKVVNSQEFKDRILNFSYTFNGQIINGFKLNKGMTNQQIYILFMSGWDKHNKAYDNDIDISTTIYYNRWTSTVGYTYPNTFKTWINTKFWSVFEKERRAGIAGNQGHEYCHNLDFDHAFKDNPTRKFTVPYAIGSIIYELAMDYQLEDQSERVLVCTRFLWFFKRCKWVKK